MEHSFSVADKRHVKKSIKQLQRIKTWQLLILLVLMGLLAATFLRLNNIGMVERRTAVLQSDEAGDTTALKNNLFSLQRWSASHMNASTDAFYLEKSYNKAVKKAVQKANQNTSNISKVAAKARRAADAVCQQRFSGYGVGYSQCFAAEFAKAAPSQSDQLAAPELPRPGQYRHEFVSPKWSPDFAGWSLVICGVITVVIILRLVSLLILKALLRRHYSSI